jgi:hypothetical protein
MDSSASVGFVPLWAKRVTWLAAVVWIVGLGISTVYRAGPYQVGADKSGLQELSRWEKRLGFSLDQNGSKFWGSHVHRTDFSIYTAVGRAIIDGTDIYEAENIRGWHYNNAPVFGLLFVPFAVMPLFWAALIWYVLSAAMVIAAIIFCVRMVQQDSVAMGEPFWLYVIPPVLLIWPLMSALARGQMTPFMFALVMAGLYCQWRGREWLGGSVLAGAILMKIFPVLLLPYFVWRKRWRFVLATLLAVVLGALVVPAAALGWNTNVKYLQEWGSILQRPMFEQERSEDSRFGELSSPDLVRNQSLQAVLKRITKSSSARWFAAAIGLAMVAAMIAVALQVREKNQLLMLSTVIVWAVLMSPVSWSHYFMLLMLPVAAATWMAILEQDVSTRRVAVITLVGFGVLALSSAGSRALQVYGPICWGTMVLWGGLLLCARGSRGLWK